MYRRLAVLAAGAMLLCAVSMHGQDAVLSQMYGNGVHAYFAGNYAEAHDLFTSAIDAGTKDPRCYYYRGLAYAKLGREQEAKMDFEKGAELETADVNNIYQVGRALQRIQGNQRLVLEQHRAGARLAAMERAQAAARARYDATRATEAALIQEQVKPAPVRPLEAPTLPQPPDEPAAPKPFEEVPAEKPAEKPQAPAVEPTEPVMPAEKPAEPSPFEPKPEEKPEMKPEEPEEKPAENPFEAKPKAKPEEPEEKPEMKPEEPAEKPDENPFGPGPAAPAEKPAAPKAGGILGALMNAAGKAGADAVGSAVDSAAKIVPGAAGPGASKTMPVPPPGLPGMKEQPMDEPEDEEPAPPPVKDDPLGEKPAPSKPAPKVELPNPFE